MTSFEKTPGWLDFHPRPSVPRFKLPAGAVDAHCHVFGPGADFPYAPERKYTPCDAGKAKLFALRDRLGFERNVIVQATCHGTDNRALVDACRASRGRARGVASVHRTISDADLEALHSAGVRGVRFNFVKRLVDFTPREELQEIAKRIHALGWHVVVYFEAPDLPELWGFFSELPTRVVVDHLGRPDVAQPVDGPEFELFLRLLREHENIWTKVSCPERLSHRGPPALEGERLPYRDVIPFARRVVEEFPDRVLWGTDWPHPNLKQHMPDDGLLVDFIPLIAVTRELQRQLLVTNPMQLYWPEESSVGLQKPYQEIPGTTIFDAEQARKGYWLNQFCMSLMQARNRERFKANERAYLDEWPMTEEQKHAVLDRDLNKAIASGGNIYFLAKIGATDGKSFQQMAASMTGLTEEQYRGMMLGGGRSPEGNRAIGEEGDAQAHRQPQGDGKPGWDH
ncbi:MAG TPA: protocatechuate 4,5-dioxygenase subunit alpha [Polyangiaceae bacterium]|jgi:2-pyrone-4,6-dicarboxylate lactonase|nr:protocatechuate 4,5-dioxygenase subunit alpha [Polyangiaceae bacterium]